MIQLLPINDAADPRVNEYRSLTDVGLRRRREPAEGIFMAESHQVIARAATAGYPVRSVLTTPRWISALEDLADDPVIGLGLRDVPVFVADPEIVANVTGYRVHRGALAAMTRLPLPAVDDVLSNASRILVLEGMVDHTNVGAVFRSAAGLGFDAVVVDPTCADPLYRRSVRVSMGAVFSVPWTRISPWPSALTDLADCGWSVAALTPLSTAEPLVELAKAPPDRLALVVGSEGPGLSKGALQAVTRQVQIPMASGIDSLNVAAAVAVACYALGHASHSTSSEQMIGIDP